VEASIRYYRQNKQNKFGFQKYPLKKNTNETCGCGGFFKKVTTFFGGGRRKMKPSLGLKKVVTILP
jgi:hypothetical protein